MVTLIVVEFSTTWLLVRTSPDELMIIPVPAAAPPDASVVLMSTIAGSILAAMADALALPPVDPGVCAVIGFSGCVAVDAVR